MKCATYRVFSIMVAGGDEMWTVKRQRVNHKTSTVAAWTVILGDSFTNSAKNDQYSSTFALCHLANTNCQFSSDIQHFATILNLLLSDSLTTWKTPVSYYTSSLSERSPPIRQVVVEMSFDYHDLPYTLTQYNSEDSSLNTWYFSTRSQSVTYLSWFKVWSILDMLRHEWVRDKSSLLCTMHDSGESGSERDCDMNRPTVTELTPVRYMTRGRRRWHCPIMYSHICHMSNTKAFVWSNVRAAVPAFCKLHFHWLLNSQLLAEWSNDSQQWWKPILIAYGWIICEKDGVESKRNGWREVEVEMYWLWLWERTAMRELTFT